MTAPGHPERALSDPIGLIVDLVTAVEHRLEPDRIRAVVTGVAGGRAKSRRLAAHLAEHPSVLSDGRSPAPRAVGDLLIALREAGAQAVSPPCCAECSREMRTLQRRGQDWYCWNCGPQPEPCAACGNTRRVASRDRAGRPRCGKCPDTDGRDPIAVIGALVAGLDPQAGQEVIADAVRRSAPRPSYQQKLAWALESNPALLTGDGHLAPHRAILRLLDLLHKAGVAGIVRPSCPGCHRVVRIDKPLDGQRVCRTCISHSRVEECSGCGARREPATRDDHGRPLCPNCLVNDPANLETCINCGRRKVVNTRTPDGPLCSSCPSLPIVTCSICDEEKPCGTSRTTGRPWCPDCQRRSASCSVCGGIASIVSGTLDQPLCADCTAPEVWHTCPTCTDSDYPHPGQCARCLINRRLNELLGHPSDALHTGLEALRHNIATTEHPTTARRWLNKPSVAPVLADLAAGRRALTHGALDELPDSPPLAHLRQVLVGVGALPERDEYMVRLERFLTSLLASQQDPEQRKVLHRYTIWHLVRRLRRRNNGRPLTPQQFISARQRTHAAVAFQNWLTAHDLTLETCQRADLDRWLTDDLATYRRTAGHFIRWARANKLTTVHVPAVRWNGPTQPLDDEQRWNVARRLLHDHTLKPEDRLAGLLLLLYAQGPSAIHRLTTEDVAISAQEVRLHLGDAPVQLPEPVAQLARTVVANRKGHATIGALAPSPWLFPGGQPGRPISTTQLTQRLNNLGIRPNQARSTALFQLATEIPAAILARTLGIHTDVAVAWQRLSAGDWTTYAAEVIRRPSNRTSRLAEATE
ncbi:site-specific integrase [Streptomyces sp. SCSIO 30461]|uniref:site-specific integrase n=1 Tax=Streptomyces sp. SCSIO 30461 TaxID=3118085 RepID=UPI0030CF7047